MDLDKMSREELKDTLCGLKVSGRSKVRNKKNMKMLIQKHCQNKNIIEGTEEIKVIWEEVNSENPDDRGIDIMKMNGSYGDLKIVLNRMVDSVGWKMRTNFGVSVNFHTPLKYSIEEAEKHMKKAIGTFRNIYLQCVVSI
ncbi:hypothetical protein KKH36_00610 [Patescibacteria group bacterium]|nr:hypothetical protein [Patescibacteria group bacterium]